MKKEELAKKLWGYRIMEDMYNEDLGCIKVLTEKEETLIADDKELVVCCVYPEKLDINYSFNVYNADLIEMSKLVCDSFYLYKNKSNTISSMTDIDLSDLKDTLNYYDIELANKMLKFEITEFSKPFNSWEIATEIPHAYFEIQSENGFICRGLVMDLKDINNYLKN